MSSSSALESGLYIVATPIGHADDITLRALEVLRNVDAILCEDTRKTDSLLQHHGIKKSLYCYHEHSTEKDRQRYISLLQQGKKLALASDAGTPLISDPGYKLIQAARAQGIAICTLPGPCAAIAALTLSGLPCHLFRFEGFLPEKQKDREKRLQLICHADHSSILYETARNMPNLLTALTQAGLQDRSIAICREITKPYEEVITGSVAEVLESLPKRDEPLMGEIVVVIGPAILHSESATLEAEALQQHNLLLRPFVEALLQEHKLSSKDISQLLSQHFGMSKKEAYAYVLQMG